MDFRVHYLVHSLPKVVSISRPLCFVLKMLWVVTRTCSTATREEVAADQDSQGRVISPMVEEQLDILGLWSSHNAGKTSLYGQGDAYVCRGGK